MIKQTTLSLIALTGICAVSQADVVGLWNDGATVLNDTHRSYDSVNASSKGLGDVAGDTFEGTGTDAGKYLSYQTFGQIAGTGTAIGTIPTITHTDVYAGASVSALAANDRALRFSRLRFNKNGTTPYALNVGTWDVDGAVDANPIENAGQDIFAGVVAVSITGGTQLQDIASIDHQVDNANKFGARWWVELGDGTQMVSDSFSFNSNAINNYAFDYSALSWVEWELGAFDSVVDGDVDDLLDSDFSWSKTVTSTAVTLSGTEDVALFGLTFEADSQTTGFTTDTMVINAVPEPSTYALLGGMAALGYVMTRRRR